MEMTPIITEWLLFHLNDSITILYKQLLFDIITLYKIQLTFMSQMHG